MYRSPGGVGRLEMIHRDPNGLRMLLRETTQSKKKKVNGSEAGI